MGGGGGGAGDVHADVHESVSLTLKTEVASLKHQLAFLDKHINHI